jgi:uncharacterized protein YlxW (UPF0749 family)
MSSTPDSDRPSKGRSWFTFGGLRVQLLVAVLLAALGFATVVQVRLTRADDNFTGQRRDDLIELLDSLSAASDRARSQLDDLEANRDDLLSSTERRQAAIDEGTQRLDVLRILTGTVATEGPGITVTITDPDSAVTASTLLNGVEELRDAGAESIEINDVVRVVASTAFTEVDGVVSADGVELRPPYVIDVIGSSHTLSEAVVFRGGLSDEVAQLGGSTDVKQKDLVEIGSLHTLEKPEYSQPTGG